MGSPEIIIQPTMLTEMLTIRRLVFGVCMYITYAVVVHKVN